MASVTALLVASTTGMTAGMSFAPPASTSVSRGLSEVRMTNLHDGPHRTRASGQYASPQSCRRGVVDGSPKSENRISELPLSSSVLPSRRTHRRLGKTVTGGIDAAGTVAD